MKKGLERIFWVFKTYSDQSFIGSIIIYVLVRVFRSFSWVKLPNFLLYNLTDFLCLPILLTITHIFIKILFPKQLFKISLIQIGLLALFYSVLFEYILPKYSVKHTADYIDVLMYFLGGGYYWLYKNIKINKVINDAV